MPKADVNGIQLEYDTFGDWRANRVGKVRQNLPFFKELAYEYFTHDA